MADNSGIYQGSFTPMPVDVAWLLAATRDRNPIHVWSGPAPDGHQRPPIAQGIFGIGHVYTQLAVRFGVDTIRAIESEFRKPMLVGAPVSVNVTADSALGARCDGATAAFEILSEAAQVLTRGTARFGAKRPDVS